MATKPKKGKSVALKPVEEKKNKLSMIATPIGENQLAFLLGRTPANHIFRRKGKGGQEFEYVTGIHIKKVLNYVFGWLWSFEIVSERLDEKQVIVQGKLTINDKKGNPLIIKMQYGRADIKKLKDGTGSVDLGNDFKAAATDALKKCASEIGIAGDVYGRQEFREINLEDAPATEEPVKPETLDELLKVIEEKKLDTKAVCKKFKIENLADINEKTAQTILVNLKK